MSIQRWRESEVMVADNDHGWWVKYDDHIKEVNRASETYYQQYVDAMWQISYLTERIHYLERDAADIFQQGYLEGIEDCISIANEEKFLNDMGKQIPAMGALWNIIVKMQELKGTT